MFVCTYCISSLLLSHTLYIWGHYIECEVGEGRWEKSENERES